MNAPLPPRPANSLADSPWFWLCVFSAAALVALTAIGPKYLRRQARLENRFEHRVDAWRARDQAGSTEFEPEVRPGESNQLAPESIRSTLAPLGVVLCAVALWSSYRLLRDRQSTRVSGSGSTPAQPIVHHDQGANRV